ncbi:hypothetical protein [Microcystis aeruginosa]|uniref:SPOR domain-containing protein n=1 Tax=Microcystis aeruginosa NIES-4285 TaxID=2497681 RepID=A0A402DDW7_MICAE|nr:hypothetical protein [Microcystis aeruginosa]GCE60397.1 hypothetical protein MiAbB_02318 [Microcystis aeruginosa NIES-4285]
MQYYYRFILTILTLSISFADLASSQNKSNNPSFGVVYSSDRDIQQAKWETDQLAGRLSQYQNQAKLFKRRNWYVGVIVFPSPSDAKESLPIIENTYSRGSFVVNLQEWCRPDWNKNTEVLKGVSYYDCRRGEIIPGRTGAIITNITNEFSTIKDAKSDLEKLKRNTFQKQQHNLTIFKRGDSYFTAVINYANKEEAKKNIPNGKKFRDVDIKDWCNPSGDPKSGYLTKDDYIQCQNK